MVRIAFAATLAFAASALAFPASSLNLVERQANGTAAAAAADQPGSQNVGKGDGSQFITGQCASDADCASGCCANPNGVCSAPAVANENGKAGCGFTGGAGAGAAAGADAAAGAGADAGAGAGAAA